MLTGSKQSVIDGGLAFLLMEAGQLRGGATHNPCLCIDVHFSGHPAADPPALIRLSQVLYGLKVSCRQALESHRGLATRASSLDETRRLADDSSPLSYAEC